jgi:integrase
LQQKLHGKHPQKINLDLFEQSIRSEYTGKVYRTCLNKYFQFPSSRNFLECKDPRKVEDNVIQFVILLKKQGKGFGAIHNYVSAISKYYRTKRVYLNTKHINEYLPEFKKSKKDRSYSYEEIRRLLDIADERLRTIILLLACTGMRIGAIPGIRLRNLEKIEIDAVTSIYKITIYENTNYEYTTFCTHECAKAVNEYLKFRENKGEKLTQNSFLIREQFDIRDPFKISRCKEVKSNTIIRKLIDLAERSGIRQREVLTVGKHSATIRKDVPVAHGFRKFFTNKLIEAGVRAEARWLLEGRVLLRNDRHYVRQDENLLEEYQKGIDNLTIDPANRLQRTIETLKVDKSRMDMLEAKIQKLERRHR